MGVRSSDAAALGEQEKTCLKLFIETGCANCHSGVNIGGGMYAPFGVVEKPGSEFLPPDDHGRFEVTKSVDDEYVYKVPTLPNIALTPPYFDTGRSWDLRQALAVMATSKLGAELSAGDIDVLTAFLRSRTGKQPQVIYPTLPPSVATTPTPKP